MELAKILADNSEYLKINNIEKAIGLKKTALVRMIARKEIPAKHKDKIEKWWIQWVGKLQTVYFEVSKYTLEEEDQEKQLQVMVKNTPTDLREKANILGKEVMRRIEESIFTGTPILGFLEHNAEIEKQIAAIKAEKIPAERNTTLGKKIWASEQQKRILQLQKQLK